jgi:hypothetical protein
VASPSRYVKLQLRPCLFSALKRLDEFCRNLGSEKTTNCLYRPVRPNLYCVQQDIHFNYKCNREARPCNNCYSGKTIIITYSECVSVDLVIQHVMRMHLIVICDLLRSTIFPTLSQKRHDFRRKLLNSKWVF